MTGVTRPADRAGEIAIAGAKQVTYQLVEFGGFCLIAQLRPDRLGIVAQPIDRCLPLLADQRIEALFEHFARQGAREPAAPGARIAKIFEIGARGGSEPHPAERSVAVDRLRPSARAEGQTGQRCLPFLRRN